MEWRARAECSVSGALALVLRVSQVVGVAPLQLERQSNVWNVSVSPMLRVYSYILLIVLNSFIYAALILDLCDEPARSVRVMTPMTRVVWTADVVIVTLISSVGVLGAPTRMRKMIQYMNQLHKINSEIGCEQSDKLERKRSALVSLSIVATCLLTSIDFFTTIYEAEQDGRHWKLGCMYVCYYCEYLMTVSLELQFGIIALSAHSTMRSVNDALRRSQYVLDIQSKHNLKHGTTLATNSINVYPTKSVNIVVDSLSVWGRYADYTKVYTHKTLPETIRHLACSHVAVCDVVREVDKCNGSILLLLLVSFLLHLVVTPYYLIMTLLSGADLVPNMLLQLCWCVFHVMNMVFVVEPCYRTQLELDRTQVLVSQLSRFVTSPHDPLTIELDYFTRQLYLNNVKYSPLGICTLERPLIATIFGGVTTYLVIIIQFQKLYDQNSI